MGASLVFNTCQSPSRARRDQVSGSPNLSQANVSGLTLIKMISLSLEVFYRNLLRASHAGFPFMVVISTVLLK